MKRCFVFSAIFLTACGVSPPLPYPVKSVSASVETAPMTGRGDRADDPALWVNIFDPGRSLILGTNKEEGLYVYDLEGSERQRLPVGRLNNVDVRGEIAVGSNDETGGLSWFLVDPADQTVTHLGDTPVERVEPYGICLGVLEDVLVAAVTYKDGAMELWQASAVAGSAPSARLARTVQLGSQLEGCVFDDANARLFIGEEAVGIWSLALEDEGSQPQLVDAVDAGNGLVADVEGLSLYIDGSHGYLIASAQAADRFIIYDRLPPHTPRGALRIDASADGAIDAVTHTDGIDLSATPLPGFPRGLLIVQDDGNPASGRNQNFKLVSWAAVESALDLPTAD